MWPLILMAYRTRKRKLHTNANEATSEHPASTYSSRSGVVQRTRHTINNTSSSYANKWPGVLEFIPTNETIFRSTITYRYGHDHGLHDLAAFVSSFAAQSKN